MPRFSQKSLDQLATCEPELQRLFNAVINHWDCIILEGHRTEEQQKENVRKGVSKTMNSKHLHSPSRAVDVAPFPLDWNDLERFKIFGGFVLGMAAALGIPIVWGGDWNGNKKFTDQTFFDYPHFELVPK
jgi:peptidoglycan LD-endopeptidase CwlK